MRSALEAIARFEGGTPSIFVRVGHDGNGAGTGSACYLDLADPAGQAVKIGREGWSVVEDPRVHFRRRTGTCRFPFPPARARSTCSDPMSISPTAISAS